MMTLQKMKNRHIQVNNRYVYAMTLIIKRGMSTLDIPFHYDFVSFTFFNTK